MAIARQRIHLPPACWRGAVTSAVRGRLWEGDDVDRLEREFTSFIGCADSVAVASGRAGLRLILESLDLEPGAEVICSGFGYPVVPHLAKSMGYTLRLADCEMKTLGMDPAALAETISERTAAVIVTHLYGVPCRIREIAEIADAHGATLIEDCAHCGGATVGGRQTGSFGRLAYFSFETSKMINTLGGGMITCSDAALGARLRTAARAETPRTAKWLVNRLVRTTFEATVTSPLVFNLAVQPALRLSQRNKKADDRFASGYHGDHVTLRGRLGRFTNYQAQLGLRQFARMGPRLERRVANARRLIEPLREHVTFQEPAGPDHEPNYMLVTARFADMPRVVDELQRRGVDTKHHYMRDCTGLIDTGERFPNSTRAEAEVLHLPAYPELGDRQIDKVVAEVRAVATSFDSRPAPSETKPTAVDVQIGPAAKGLASAAQKTS